MTEPDSQSLLSLIKKGNKSSAMHSLADAVNQGFVFLGSILSEKRPARRFPTGFGRVINIFCMVAVIVVTIMAYETIREGMHLIQHPAESHGGLWLNVAVLLLNLLIDGAILIKAMKEINVESRTNFKGLAIIPGAFKNVGRAAPPTRLVFYEDLVAVTGALLALLAVLVISLSNYM